MRHNSRKKYNSDKKKTNFASELKNFNLGNIWKCLNHWLLSPVLFFYYNLIIILKKEKHRKM